MSDYVKTVCATNIAYEIYVECACIRKQKEEKLKYLLAHLARFRLTSSPFAKGRHSVNLLVDIHGGVLF